MNKSQKQITFQEERKIDRALPVAIPDPEEQIVSQNLDQCISRIPGTLQEEPLVQKLIEIIKTIKTSEIQDFAAFKIFNTYVNAFQSLMQNSLLEEGDRINDSHEIMESLNILAKKKIEFMQMNFMNNVLKSADPKELLFDERSTFTPENIKKRYYELSLCFHPDKNHFSSNEERDLSQQLFIKSEECKKNLLKDLNEEHSSQQKLVVYEEKGNEYWGMAQDCKEAAARHWDRLKVLTKDSFSHLKEEEMIRMMREYILIARDSYRACCKIADSNQNLEKQIRFRKSIALCFYSEGQYLEAQLYALAAIQLILNNANAKKKDLEEAIKVLDKIKGVRVSIENRSEGHLTQTDEKALILPQNCLAEASYNENESFQKTVREHLRLVASELTLKSDRSLVKYQYPPREILRAMRNAEAHKVAGVTTMLAGGAGGGIATFLGTQEILSTTALLAAGVTAGPIVAIAAGLTTIGLGVWGGVHLWKKGNSLYQQPEIRERLNRIIAEAVQFYDNGQSNEFIEKLMEEYKPGKSLLTFDTVLARIDPEKIIDNLLFYGFRPDGIAYLLNLIGEVLLSGKISRPGITKSDFEKMAQELFSGSRKESLEKAAKNLDSRIPELRKKSRKSKILRIVDRILLRDHSEIAQEYLKDSQEIPFKARLEEMRYISSLNIAIIRILHGEIDDAMEKIKSVQSSMKNNKCVFSKSQTRLEALEDFFWVVSGKDLNDINLEDEVPIVIGGTKVIKDYF